jgi:hypothetical protein
MDRSYPQTAYTSLSQTRLYSSIDKPLDNSDPRSLAMPQPVALDSFALRPPLFTVAQPGLDECHALHTSPQTMSSPKFPTAAGSPVVPIAPIPLCSPGQAHGDNALTPDHHEPEDNAEPRSSRDHHLGLPITAQQSDPPLPDFHSRYAQAFSLMTSMFGSTLTPAKVIIVIRTGDKLIRGDAITFLRDQLPLWKGIWYQSNLLMPVINVSTKSFCIGGISSDNSKVVFTSSLNLSPESCSSTSLTG